MARFFLGIAHHCGGDYAAAAENFREVVVLLADRPDERFGEPGLPAQCALAFRSWSLGELGRFDEAIAVGAEALRIAEAVDQPFTLMHGYFLGIAYLERGDLEYAVPLLERGHALCRATDLHLWSAEIAANLGYAYALADRFDDAAPVLEAALAEATATDLKFTQARQLALVGQAYWIGGRRAEAESLAARALAAARAHKQRGQEALALYLSGLLADEAHAEACFREALGLSSALSMQPLVARCHLELGRLHRRRGKAATAVEHFAAATQLFDQMGMALWLARARAS